uniref:Dopamine beta-hydroxylase n=1 Tax=Schistosoma mansoni TaxID=6183 RepID=A0A5K4F0A7_SCHMA
MPSNYLLIFILLHILFIQYYNCIIHEYTLLLNQNDHYKLQWSIDDDNNDNKMKWLNFNVCYHLSSNEQLEIKNLKFFGIGFGKYDEPINLDMYLLYFPLYNKEIENNYKDNYLFMEAYTDENSILHIRDSIESQLYTVQFPNMRNINNNDQQFICFNFGRMATSCRENGYSINNQTTHLFLFHSIYDHISRHDVIYQMWLHRIGLTPMISLNNLEMKQIPYKKILLQLIKSSSYTDFKVTEDIKIFSLHVHKVEVPAVETTYWCKTIELPYFSEPHHIVRYENDIQERSQGFIHHMEVFRCPGHNKRYYDAPCNSETKPEDLIDCREVIAAWAMGSTGLTFPEEAGYPIGGLSGKEYAVIEIHYYNPDNISGIIDNSGFRFYITNQLRKYDVGIMELGLVYTPNNFIPFKQSNFFLSGYCDSQCTDITLPKPNGIFVFASQLHTHLTGIKVVTYHIRNGTRLPDLNRDNYYSPHFQEIRQLDQQIQIKPGDTLITRCTYDTSQKNQITFGGIRINDEMCLNYIFYYPKIDLELCKSDISIESLNIFLNTLDDNENQQNDNSLMNRVNNIKWKQEEVEQLKRFYKNAPIEMHCNSSSGTRIKNSKIYRFPEIIPLDDQDDSYNEECSRNDENDDWLT